jgi:CRP/FNR family transcriptional regulator, nitrogen oxide reductase regulator
MLGRDLNERMEASDFAQPSSRHGGGRHVTGTDGPYLRGRLAQHRSRREAAELSRESLHSPIADTTLEHQLADVPLFKGVLPEALQQIIALAHLKHVTCGEFFFNEGDDALEFFVLTSGRVKLTQVTSEGNQVVLGHIGPGDAFGGVGSFGDPTYPVAAETVEPSMALAWTSCSMQHVLQAHSIVALNAIHFIADRLHDLQHRYRQLMTERVERRVARALLRLVREAGRRVDVGIEIDFPVSRQDIAEMTGTTLYTVSRLMSSWEERGILGGGRQHVVLLKPHALVTIAEDLQPS